MVAVLPFNESKALLTEDIWLRAVVAPSTLTLGLAVVESKSPDNPSTSFNAAFASSGSALSIACFCSGVMEFHVSITHVPRSSPVRTPCFSNKTAAFHNLNVAVA